jgi:hypothetical protein
MDVSHGSKELNEIVMPSRSWTHLNWLILPRLHYVFGVAFCIRSSPEQIETNRIIIHSTFNMDIKCDIRSRSLPRRGRTNAISIAFLPFSNDERVELIRLAWPPTERGAKEHRRCRSPYLWCAPQTDTDREQHSPGHDTTTKPPAASDQNSAA